MELEVNKLNDNKKYKCLCDMMYFMDEDDIKTGKWIKENIPFDISPNQGWKTFFKEI